MADHSQLMRHAAEHDISHVRLGEAVAYIEANLDPEKAAEAVSLIHAAISPGYAQARARGVHLQPEVAPEAAGQEGGDAAPEGPALDTMSAKELRAEAESRGVDLGKAKSKDAMRALIEAHIAAQVEAPPETPADEPEAEQPEAEQPDEPEAEA